MRPLSMMLYLILGLPVLTLGADTDTFPAPPAPVVPEADSRVVLDVGKPAPPAQAVTTLPTPSAPAPSPQAPSQPVTAAPQSAPAQAVVATPQYSAQAVTLAAGQTIQLVTYTVPPQAPVVAQATTAPPSATNYTVVAPGLLRTAIGNLGARLELARHPRLIPVTGTLAAAPAQAVVQQAVVTQPVTISTPVPSPRCLTLFRRR